MPARIDDIGTRDGPLLLFGGPYSNAEATQALLAQAGKQGIPPGDRICTGDVVAYCADPVETWSLLAGQAQVVAGNCERQLGAGSPDCGCGFGAGSACDLWAQRWYAHAAGLLTDPIRAAMAACPDMIVLTHRGLRIAVIHGGLTDISRYLWPSDPEEAFGAEIAAITAATGPVDIVVGGHCGLAFQRRIGPVLWVNAGVIGMPPNDGRPKTRYAILDGGSVTFHRLGYDPRPAAAKIRAAGLPTGYADALETGFWPKEDILPAACRNRP